MNQVNDKGMRNALKKLNDSDASAAAIFEWLAGRTNDASETPVARAAQMANIPNSEVIRVFKALADLGFGTFKNGRRGAKSRIEWDRSVRSIGQAARGEAETVETINVWDLDPDPEEDVPEAPFTIAEAKRRLAITFGVNPDAVEIIIKG